MYELRYDGLGFGQDQKTKKRPCTSLGFGFGLDLVGCISGLGNGSGLGFMVRLVDLFSGLGLGFGARV